VYLDVKYLLRKKLTKKILSYESTLKEDRL